MNAPALAELVGEPVEQGVDLAGMVIPLGLFFGRMGCFLGGCCFGRPIDWGSGIELFSPGLLSTRSNCFHPVLSVLL